MDLNYKYWSNNGSLNLYEYPPLPGRKMEPLLSKVQFKLTDITRAAIRVSVSIVTQTSESQLLIVIH